MAGGVADAANGHGVERTTSRGTIVHTANRGMSEAAVEITSGPMDQHEAQTALPVTSDLRRHLMAILTIFGNLLQMVVNFSGLGGGFELGKLLGASTANAQWIAASYGLTQGAFVLIAGPIGAVYGHKNMLIYGTLWLGVCNLVCGFCDNFIAFVIMRALAGIGGGFIMPNAVAILTITNPPGPTRNLLLGFFGASAPLGGWLGALFLGLFQQYTAYKWFFLLIFLLCTVTALALNMLIPHEVPVNRHGKLDWTGAGLVVAALILFCFAWNQAAGAGWSDAAVITCLIVSIVLLGLFLGWEQYVAPHPIMPLSIFKAPSFGVLILVVLFNFMAVGIFCWYQVLWLQEIWNWSLLHFALSWTPFVICAIAAASLSAWLVPRLDAQWILAIGTLTILAACLLMATLTERRIYWPQVFPSVVLYAFSPDLVYTAAQIIASNSVGRQHQGTAGSLISVLNLYGVSLGLGFAGTIEVQTNDHGRNKVLGFRAALYFGVAIAAVAVLVDVFFIRCVKDKKRGWDESDLIQVDQELEDRATTSGASPLTASNRV
ncbi:hypothetical protein A1O1_04472 [Capronia coronata CBS 617.96]|uniref:Major facilitator superfamily (MFS) profile domain-containing protein n=1 Tax=Capronia coronata CBS 617.96 TaxID=1182541 RepID=W9YNZ1_9EURO|nr:uncharacterized protein A1O1_04472 [Capronia coronata CBS 617.96]EXJ91360.1 hypothetical protein A1O1_04472 [Capronia coronata CBS 617.96]